jgi:hypothetical protein
MKTTKFIIAAGLAIATTGAFAETGVTTYQAEHVANIYGRASAPNVQIAGADARQAGNVADSGSDAAKGETKVAVKAGTEVQFGRS